MKLLFPTLMVLLQISVAAAEDQLPIQKPVTAYSAVWENCPFNREVVKAIEAQISSTFGKNLALDGLSHDSILGPIAYLRDLKDNQPIMVTGEASEAHPYTIVEAKESNDPREAKVTITNGQEVAEIGYTANLMTQKIAQPVATGSGNGKGSATAAPTQAAQKNPDSPSVPGSPPLPANPSANSQDSPEPSKPRRRVLLPPRPQN